MYLFNSTNILENFQRLLYMKFEMYILQCVDSLEFSFEKKKTNENISHIKLFLQDLKGCH